MKPRSFDFCFSNYHTHTPRCMHALGSEEEYILQAIETGYDILGFADHTPWPYKSDFVATMRMRLDQLDGYLRTLRSLKMKYSGRIELRVGLECEAFPEFYPWLEEIREEKRLDYFILGNHYDTNDETHGRYFGYCRDKEMIYRYMETTIEGMESGHFIYLAHPYLFLNGYPKFDADCERICREICAAAQRLDMPLEYNILGFTRQLNPEPAAGIGYTQEHFWEIASEYNIRSIIGVDAHQPHALDCTDHYTYARDMMKRLGIPVIDRLDLPKAR